MLVGDVRLHMRFALKMTPLKNADFDQYLLITSTLRANEKKFNYREYEVYHELSNELRMKCVRHRQNSATKFLCVKTFR